MTPLNYSNLLAQYEAACEISNRMLDCAKQQQWDTLIEYEKHREVLFDAIRHIDIGPWDSPLSNQKEYYLRKILAFDSETKHLATQQMCMLERERGSVGNEVRLQKAYQLP